MDAVTADSTRSGTSVVSKVSGSLYAFLERTKRTTHGQVIPDGSIISYCLLRALFRAFPPPVSVPALVPDDVGSLSCAGRHLHGTQHK